MTVENPAAIIRPPETGTDFFLTLQPEDVARHFDRLRKENYWEFEEETILESQTKRLRLVYLGLVWSLDEAVHKAREHGYKLVSGIWREAFCIAYPNSYENEKVSAIGFGGPIQAHGNKKYFPVLYGDNGRPWSLNSSHRLADFPTDSGWRWLVDVTGR